MSETRSFAEGVYRPGEPVQVVLNIVPPPQTLAYALEETPPLGWAVQGVGDGGNHVGGIIKWGVFFDGSVRTFSYQCVPPPIETEPGRFFGLVSYDGVSREISGKNLLIKDNIPPQPPF